MTKIYLQNPEKTQVIVFDNKNQFGDGFDTWIKLTQDEITQYLLKEAKNKKLADLSKFYDSSECWTYTLFSNLTKTYASLTRDAYFFAKLLPCCGGKTIQFLDDQNKVVNYSLTIEKADNLNYKINVNNGTAIRVKKLELENKIAIANTIEIIDSIDIKTELLNSVERNIDLDKFN
jgi:hypothetical protein